MSGLRAARRRAGITQASLARMAAISASHLAALEAGRSAIPYRLALRLARVLGVSASTLYARPSSDVDAQRRAR